MSLWDALRMNMMISYQELVRTFHSAEAAFFNIVKKNKHGFLPNHTKDARKAFLNECPDNGEGGSNQSMISQIISKYGKVRL